MGFGLDFADKLLELGEVVGDQRQKGVGSRYAKIVSIAFGEVGRGLVFISVDDLLKLFFLLYDLFEHIC